MTFLNWPAGYNGHLLYIYLRKINSMRGRKKGRIEKKERKEGGQRNRRESREKERERQGRDVTLLLPRQHHESC